MKTSHVVTTFAALAAILGVHCSSNVEPQPESTQQSSEALCGNGSGIHPGCGECWPDSSSSLGGTQTCTYCNGDSFTQDCRVTCGTPGAPCCNAPLKCFYSGYSCSEEDTCVFVVHLLFDKTEGAPR
jgi:hypothetical protein